MKKDVLFLKYIKEKLVIYKLFLVSRFSLMLFTVCILNINASIFSQDLKIRLNLTNVTIKEVLREIETQSEITFLYNNKDLDVSRIISIQGIELSITDALNKIFQDSNIEYIIKGKQIVLINNESAKQDSLITIKGEIIDAVSLSVLPGVTIIEIGTSNGTTTDVNGQYTITVHKNATISYSYIGYVTEEKVVRQSQTLDIVLVPDILSLNEVYVIGYGTLKKSDLTGAVASVRAEELSESVSSGIDQALQGRTAGVTITTNTGTPGGGVNVRIRGTGTTTNPDPFFVVDGVPISADDIGALNPGDIESMEILKDASAAAIYGSRAANGVVLITTKKGEYGKGKISFDSYKGVQNIVKKYDVVDAEEYIKLRNDAGYPFEDTIPEYNVDWQDKVFSTAYIENYQLSFLGGTENSRYAIIGSYFDQDGILRGTDYKRYTLRANSDNKVKSWLLIGENLSYSYSIQNNFREEKDEYKSPIINAMTADPASPVYDTTGNWYDPERNNTFNPVGYIERNSYTNWNKKLMGNIYSDIQPFEWLKYHASFGFDVTDVDIEEYIPEYFVAPADQAPTSIFRVRDEKWNSWIIENNITISKKFNKHDITLLAGYSRQRNVYRYQYAAATGVPKDIELRKLANAENPVNNTITDVDNSSYLDRWEPYDATLVSYLGRVIYSFDEKYNLTASLRRDGSSKFGPDKRWGVYPAFAAGWKISEENFMENIPFLNFLKLRAGWGQLGNQEIGDYEYFLTLVSGFDYTTGLEEAVVPGSAPLSVANQEIHWEEAVQTNIGLDINLFENQLSLNADYYIKKTKDMLVEVPIPMVVGVQQNPTINAGEVLNKGFELNIIHKKVIGDFSYNIGGNIAFLDNEVTNLGEGGIPISSAAFLAKGTLSRTELGYPIAGFYGYVVEKIFQNQEEVDKLNDLAPDGYYDTPFTMAGDYKFKDISGPDGIPDGEITDDDRTFIGSPHPDLTYGLRLELNYKNFDLSVFGQGVYGNDICQAVILLLETPDMRFNVSDKMLNYWQQEGDNTDIPRLDPYAANDNLRFSDHYIKDGSYFRIKNVQIGYNLRTLFNKYGIERFRIYIGAQNLLTITKYDGFDPEIGIGSTQSGAKQGAGNLDIGIDRGFYPVARTFLTGVNLSF